jgi:hypothetical protein
VAALGVGEQHAMAPAQHVAHDAVQSGRHLGEGRLHEQPRGAAEPESGELRRLDIDQARHRDLATGANVECHVLRSQARVDLSHQPADRLGVVGVAPAHVRSGHDRLYAGRDGSARQCHRSLDRVRAVVDAWKHMAVQVDHGPEP